MNDVVINPVPATTPDAPQYSTRAAEGAPLVLVYLDRDLRIQFANRRCHDLLGQPPRELLGRLLAELVDPGTLRYALDHVAQVERGDPAPRDYLLSDTQGTKRALRVYAAADRDSTGHSIGYVACAEGAEHALGELAGAAVCSLTAVAAGRGVRIEIRADGADTRVNGDARELQHALARLVCAAIERSPQGGSVRVRVEARDGLALFAVEDQSSEPLAGGHLGVSISRAVLRRMGGALRVASGADGTYICAELPRAVRHAAGAQ